VAVRDVKALEEKSQALLSKWTVRKKGIWQTILTTATAQFDRDACVQLESDIRDVGVTLSRAFGAFDQAVLQDMMAGQQGMIAAHKKDMEGFKGQVLAALDGEVGLIKESMQSNSAEYQNLKRELSKFGVSMQVSFWAYRKCTRTLHSRCCQITQNK
jgi:hypothetical protein